MTAVADLFRRSFPDADPVWQLSGIDVSGNQPELVVSNLVAGGVQFDWVIVKASEGALYRSVEAARQVHDARRAGKSVGFYHWVSFRSSPQAEFENLAQVLTQLGVSRDVAALPAAVWLDAEDGQFWLHVVSGSGYDRYVADLADLIKARFGCQVGVYTAAWWADGRLGERCGVLPLWVSDYDDQRVWPQYRQPRLPVAWTQAALWQWTSSTPELGSLDLNMAAVEPAGPPVSDVVSDGSELGEEPMLHVHAGVDRPAGFNGRPVWDLWIAADGSALGRMKVHSALVIMPVDPADAGDDKDPLFVDVYQSNGSRSLVERVRVVPAASTVILGVGGRVAVVYDRDRPVVVQGREVHYTT